jgi:poly(3-hydroxybutyrate) depolymerase
MSDLLPIAGAAFLAGAALLASGGAAAAQQVLAYTHQGVPRAAYLHQPASGAGPRPLVIALHGLGGTGEDYHK